MDESLRGRFILLTSLLVALVVVGFVLGGFYRRTARVTTLVLPVDVVVCAADEDCGQTNQIGCCPCELGGGQSAVNRGQRDLLKSFLHSACGGGVPCVGVPSCRTDLRPVCSDGRCILTEGGAGGGAPRRGNT